MKSNLYSTAKSRPAHFILLLTRYGKHSLFNGNRPCWPYGDIEVLGANAVGACGSAGRFTSRISGGSAFIVKRFDHMTPSICILAFSTSNYDVMIKFFRDFGFVVVEDPHDQLTPFFEHGRAARVSRASFEFQLEESGLADAKAIFNLMHMDYSDAEIERIKALGYACDFQQSIYGSFHTFHSPDGGILVL